MPLIGNKQMAARFIEALHGKADAHVTFFIIEEDGQKRNPRHLHGTLDKHWEGLERLNLAGCGIFILVQKGNGRGRKDEDVEGLNAIFTDDDKNAPTPLLPVPPSITVRSKRGYHRYWLLKAGESMGRLQETQKALAAHFDTDGAVNDLARVMRLPGTYHMKDRSSPFFVELVDTNLCRFTIDEVMGTYPGQASKTANDNGHGEATMHGRETTGANVWAQWRSEALTALDLDKVYEGLLTGKESGGGWLECRDPDSGSGDRTPSAGVADSADGVERGAFHSFRSGNTISVFDFLVKQRKAKDFHSAVGWVAEATGVAAPSSAVGRGKAGCGAWSAYKDSGAVVRDCVPILEGAFVLFRSEDGHDRIYAVNCRNEVTLILEDKPQRQKLHDTLKERCQDIPPEWLIERTLSLWPLECKKLLSEPEPFCFKGNDRLCFKRFDWEPEEGPHAAWEEFLTRLSDAEAFKAFVWSCFEKDNRSRQYLWLRGDGQDGKSVVLGVLGEVFGRAATAINNSHIKNDSRFLFSTFYGKRVVLYPDCKNTKFGMTEIVRNCTSGDSVLVEFKNQTPFTAVMRVKLFVASNSRPSFTSQAADTSRIIYVEVAPTKTKDDPEWEKRLTTELPQFLWECRKAYQALCPRGGDIDLSEKTKELTLDSVASFEEPYLELFEAHFKFEAGTRTRASDVGTILKNQGLSTNDMGAFKAWLHQCKGVDYKNRHEGRFYLNLAILPQNSTVGSA
jgi:hypothetical protein